tara:strand:- start:38 stop:799 length:762 start_codon:yes stop_codon:yes gene_type:complete
MTKQILTIYGVPHPELDYEGSSNGAITSYKEAYEHYLDGGNKTLELVDGKLTYKSYVSFRDFPKMVKAIKYVYIYELIKDHFGEEEYDGNHFFKTEYLGPAYRHREEWLKMYFFGWEKMEDTEKLNVFAEFMLDKFTHPQSNDILEAEQFLEFLHPEMNMIMSQLCDAEQERWVWDETKYFWSELKRGNIDRKLRKLLWYITKYSEKIKREKEKKIALVIHTINTACWSPHTPLGVAMFNFRLKVDGLDEIIV